LIGTDIANLLQFAMLNQLKAICESPNESDSTGLGMTYENSHIAEPSLSGESSVLDEPEPFRTMLDPNWSGLREPSWHPRSYQVVHEMFFGPMGTIYRLAAIVLMAVLLVVAVLGGISIFVAMTEILSR
jgi:hypothetical protein